mmetsp:Transcript_5783/g.11454  ORF Transcript_5783/g.11454 Transcript_5783/m.11454 type:complete len:371 (-) Transcript_5783:294-1406(-)
MKPLENAEKELIVSSACAPRKKTRRSTSRSRGRMPRSRSTPVRLPKPNNTSILRSKFRKLANRSLEEARVSEEDLVQLLRAIRSVNSSFLDRVVIAKTKERLLHIAARTSLVECVNALIQCGASVNLSDSQGNTPLNRAFESLAWATKRGDGELLKRCEKVVRILEDANATVKTKSAPASAPSRNYGSTNPLSIASISNLRARNTTAEIPGRIQRSHQSVRRNVAWGPSEIVGGVTGEAYNPPPQPLCKPSFERARSNPSAISTSRGAYSQSDRRYSWEGKLHRRTTVPRIDGIKKCAGLPPTAPKSQRTSRNPSLSNKMRSNSYKHRSGLSTRKSRSVPRSLPRSRSWNLNNIKNPLPQRITDKPSTTK